MKVVSIAQMHRAEEKCACIGLPPSTLMENAGRAVAEEVRRILGGIGEKYVLVLVGPGNNGGDGLVAARYLHDWGVQVKLYFMSQRPTDDANLKLVKERDISYVEANQDKDLSRLNGLLVSTDSVLDAVFGIGRNRPLRGMFASVLDQVNCFKKEHPGLRIIAVDLPSGLNADSGAVDPVCLCADNTITLGFPKMGLFNFPGVVNVGKITVVDIGIPSEIVNTVDKEFITAEWIRTILPERPSWANKGSFGRVLAVAGSVNYIGAAYLVCSGAIRIGAGLVTLATAANLQPFLATKLVEVTYLPLQELASSGISQRVASLIQKEAYKYNVLLIGCGLGQSQSTVRFIRSALLDPKSSLPSLVIDADALNTLAKTPGWWQKLVDDAILTPHPGEMARLLGVSVDEVQSDRLGLAKRAALEWHKTIILKGAYTVIAAPNGQSRINSAANPGLASAGTGDVLSGVIAGLLAQGLSFFDAAACGVFLHGVAGEAVRNRLGDSGMIASDLLPELPLAIKKIKEDSAAN